ncbi:MAG: sensor histidine kinase [Nitratireductor sp.]
MGIKVRRLTWHNASQSDHQLREYLILALLRSRACVMLQDDQLNYLYIANLPSIWRVANGETPADETVFGTSLGARLTDAKKRSLASGKPVKLEATAGKNRVFEMHVETVPALDKSLQVLTTIVDITETRRREQILKDLLLEVSHRSKNLLAVIQGLATQSARYSTSTEDFLSEFRGRIFSLSNAQDLVTEADWFGVRVRELAQAQSALPHAGGKTEVAFSGGNEMLTPNAALYMGLGFHELLLRSRRRNPLSGAQKIHLSCRTRRGDDGDELVVTWLADGEHSAFAGQVNHEEKRAEFSSLLLEQIVPQSLSGHAEFAATASGEEYRLVFPSADYNVRQRSFETLD